MFLYNAVSGCFSRPDPTDPSRLITRLPAGAYTNESVTSFALTLRPMRLNAEPLYPIQSYHLYYMKREIQRFFDQKIIRRLAQSGIKHRRGVLLYGPPGTGKTSLVRQVIPLLVERDAVILKNCPIADLESGIIPAVRRNDPDRPIVLIFDPFEAHAYRDSSELLKLLDGLTSPDHLLTIACSSRLSGLLEQFCNRPSRFGLTLYFERLPDGIHARLAWQKYPMLSDEQRQFAAALTRELPLDMLDEACKLFVMGFDAEEVADRIRMAVNGDDEDSDDEYSDDEDSDDEYSDDEYSD